MPEKSAGLLMYRRGRSGTEVLLVHPGGPFWARKDEGAWSLPKGIVNPGEDPLAAAKREFTEETGCEVPAAGFVFLGDFRQPSRKIVAAYAVPGDFDLACFRSNTFELEWPPKSGRVAAFPEADKAAWFTLLEADQKILTGQRPILAAFAHHIGT
jgi:predicted NUDIX family NTP pyrophosphohydrolase